MNSEELLQNLENVQELKLRMFPVMLQALYNAGKVLSLINSGDDWKLAGSDQITATLVDTGMVQDTLKKMGLCPKYRIRKNEDGTLSIRHLSRELFDDIEWDFQNLMDIEAGARRDLMVQIDKLKEKNAVQQQKLVDLQNLLGSSRRDIQKFTRSFGSVYTHHIGTFFRSMQAKVRRGLDLLKSITETDNRAIAARNANEAVSKFREALEMNPPSFDDLMTQNTLTREQSCTQAEPCATISKPGEEPRDE